MKRTIALIAALVVASGLSPAFSAGSWLPEPGAGTHIIPDPRPPRPTCPPTPTPPCPPPTPTPLPPTFGTLVPAFVKLAEDVAAMKNWFTTLTPAEQEKHRQQYEATLARFAGEEEKLATTILVPLEGGNEKPMYALLDMVRRLDPIRARNIFLGVVDRVADRVNMDYINDPQNPIKIRRARDIVMIRTWIGRN